MKPVEEFPARVVHPDRELYRVHRAVHDPFHFSAAAERGAGGRFDLPADSGSGSCYLAVSALGALVETFGRFRVVTVSMVAERRLATAVPTTSLRLADLTERSTLGEYGITGDISAGIDYRVSQRWAVRFWDAGFDGIYYTARHDPQFRERSVALFGSPDDLIDGRHKRFEVTTTPIPAEVVQELTKEFGIPVLPPTPLDDTDLFPPP